LSADGAVKADTTLRPLWGEDWQNAIAIVDALSAMRKFTYGETTLTDTTQRCLNSAEEAAHGSRLALFN